MTYKQRVMVKKPPKKPIVYCEKNISRRLYIIYTFIACMALIAPHDTYCIDEF